MRAHTVKVSLPLGEFLVYTFIFCVCVCVRERHAYKTELLTRVELYLHIRSQSEALSHG